MWRLSGLASWASVYRWGPPETEIWWYLGGVTLPCPECGKASLHHSLPRSLIERVRRRLTGRVPFRCHACDWRGWRLDVEPMTKGTREIRRELTDTELEGLDPDKPDT